MITPRQIIVALVSTGCGLALGYSIRSVAGSGADLSDSIADGTATVGQRGTQIITLSNPAGERFTTILSSFRENKTLAGRAQTYNALSQLAVAEFPDLIERSSKLPFQLRNELTAALFGRWMELDPGAAEQWIKQTGRPLTCFVAWAEFAPGRAIDYVLSTNQRHLVWSAVTTGLNRLAGTDRQARWDILAKYPPSASRDLVIKQELLAWATADPATALALASSFPDEQIRRAVLEKGLTEMTKHDPAAAISRIEELIPGLKVSIAGNDFISDFTRTLAAKDPALAVELADRLPPQLQVFPMIAAGCAWAKSEPTAALQWALANGVDPARRFRTELGSTSSSILGEAMSSQPKQTVDWLLALPEGNDRDMWLQSALFQGPAGRDADLARKIFEGMSTDRQARLARGFGQQLGSAGEIPDLQTWTAWIPDESVRAMAIAGALAANFNKTPARIETMLTELPAGPIRDQTLSALTQAQGYASPKAATARALDIRDDTLRYDALDRLMNQWMNRDPQTAGDWLHSQPDLPREWVTEWLAIKPLQ